MDLGRVVQFLRALEREGVQYVLVGAVALNVHGILRATQDVDLFVRPARENVERLKRALRAVWDDPEIQGIQLEDLAGEYPTIRYGPPDGDLVIDLMARLGDAFQYDDLAAETVLWEGVNVRVATPETLYRMKKGTLRGEDHVDAAKIRERFGIQEP
jgi:predicted nucleotidyltransferase